MGKLSEILELVKELTPNERKLLRLELSKPYKQEAGTTEPDWMLEGFIIELTKRGLWTKGLTPDLPKPYVEQVEIIKAELLRRVGDHLSYQDKLKLGRVIAQCLIYYSGPEAPISLKFLCNSISHVLPAVERSFPGYMRADMVRHLVRKGEA